jgi:hypothetical protein
VDDLNMFLVYVFIVSHYLAHHFPAKERISAQIRFMNALSFVTLAFLVIFVLFEADLHDPRIVPQNHPPPSHHHHSYLFSPQSNLLALRNNHFPNAQQMFRLVALYFPFPEPEKLSDAVGIRNR